MVTIFDFFLFSESLPSLSPMSEKLEHLGKARPKRPKTRAPTRPGIQGKELREEPQDIGEGLDNFFRQQRNSLSTPTLSPDSEESRYVKFWFLL